MHNRMTHSLRVAQVSRSIADLLLAGDGTDDKIRHERLALLGGLDSDVAQAAGLTHDVGHAPFGHAGEQVLDQYAREEMNLRDGFEGNAQTLRILTRSERRYLSYPGLDLTRASRAAVLKYPWVRGTRTVDHDDRIQQSADYRRRWEKFNSYDEDMAEILDARQFIDSPASEIQTVEASIMDVADDISYAIHDLEDFVLAEFITSDRISEWTDAQASAMSELKAKLSNDYDEYYDDGIFHESLEVVKSLLVRAVPETFEGTADDVGQVRHRCSEMVGQYVAAVDLSPESPAKPFWKGGPHITLRRDEWHQIQILKAITKNVVRSPIVEERQAGEKATLDLILRRLFDWLVNDFDRLPRPLRQMVTAEREHETGNQAQRESRCIIDYLCTLTDSQTNLLFDWLYGRTGRELGYIGAQFARLPGQTALY